MLAHKVIESFGTVLLTGKSEEEVRQYFMEHLQQEQQRDKGEAALDHGDEENSAAQVQQSPCCCACVSCSVRSSGCCPSVVLSRTHQCTHCSNTQ